MNSDLAAIRDALTHADTTCRFHGTDFERSGMQSGLPRCTSCQQPWRIVRALAALDRLDVADPLSYDIQIGNGNQQTNTYWGR